jgi:hypothetical protein
MPFSDEEIARILAACDNPQRPLRQRDRNPGQVGCVYRNDQGDGEWTGEDLKDLIELNTAYDFMHDLAARLANRVQLTTDGDRVYLEAVESAFNEDVDDAMLAKIYRSHQAETRYSPASASAARRRSSAGRPIRNTLARQTSSGRT